MKLSQLQKKYPKAFDELDIYDDKHERQIVDMTLDVRDYWKLITNFTDKQGVKIFIIPYGPYFKPIVYDYTKDKLNLGYCRAKSGDCIFIKRNDAETKAIEKAFEILEERP